MTALKHVRHEKVLREYFKAGVKTEAYARIYPNASRDAARMAAARLFAKPQIKKRYEELRQQMIKRADITIDKILADYQWVIDEGKGTAKLGEVKAAAEAQAKLVGLLRERVEAGNVGDFDNAENVSDVIEIVSASLGPEAALALAKAFKLNVAPPEGRLEVSDTDLEGAKPASDAVN
jgi:hypothetical protein